MVTVATVAMTVLGPTQAGPRLLTERATSDKYLHLFTQAAVTCGLHAPYAECSTGMRRLTTFRLMTDRIYDDGPMRL